MIYIGHRYSIHRNSIHTCSMHTYSIHTKKIVCIHLYTSTYYAYGQARASRDVAWICCSSVSFQLKCWAHWGTVDEWKNIGKP